jgi:transcriptional regulator with XRE-family HTH domain
MQSVKRMIDKALRHMASKAEIAKRLGVDQPRLSHWETGRRSMPDAAIVELAFIAGLDAKDCLGAYHLERHEKKRVGAVAGIAGLAFALAASVAPTGDATASDASHRSTHYAKLRRLLASLMRRDDRRSPFATCSQDAPGACAG